MDLASLSIRNTPPARHTFSPAQRLFGRSPHSNLPRPAASLEPSTPPRDTVVADHGHRKLKQKNAYDKHTSAPLSALPPGNYVYAKPPLTTSKAWILRKMVGHAGPRSYLIDTGKSRISRNRVQVQLAPPRSDSSNSSFYSRAERTLRDQLLPNSLTVTAPISQTPARSMEIPLSSAPAYIETSLRCAMLSPTPPLVSPVPPSPALPKSQTVTRSDRVSQRPARYSD